mmetsp:Transcript_19353/g.57513  ORF Transcript_19353/g.57513 Transcript_19353/m.57513 type:complete len:373 (-) Transcript_19353:26-1144(-)
MDDPLRTFGRGPVAPSAVLVFARCPSEVTKWGHLLPESERRVARAVLRAHRLSPRLRVLPLEVVYKLLPYLLDDERGAGARAPPETPAERRGRLCQAEAALSRELVRAREDRDVLQSPWWTRYRRAVVDSLHGLAEQCDLDLGVAHHAMRLVDLLWLLPNARDSSLRWRARTMRERAAFLCVGALRASAALHGLPAPPASKFAAHVPALFSAQCQHSDPATCERYVSQHLGWRVLAVTPLHQLQYFIGQRPLYAGPGACDAHRGAPLTPDKFERLYLYVQKWCAFFCSLCLQHHKFSFVGPSRLAAAILLVARQNLKLKPAWRRELAELTRFGEEALGPTARTILDLYRAEFPQFFPEAGEAAGARREEART